MKAMKRNCQNASVEACLMLCAVGTFLSEHLSFHASVMTPEIFDSFIIRWAADAFHCMPNIAADPRKDDCYGSWQKFDCKVLLNLKYLALFPQRPTRSIRRQTRGPQIKNAQQVATSQHNPQSEAFDAEDSPPDVARYAASPVKQSQTADRDPTLDLLCDVEVLMRGIYVPEELTDQEVANLIVRTVHEDCHASEGLI